MGFVENSGNCKYCKKQVLVKRPTPNHAFHIICSIITGGLWIIGWIIMSIKAPWRCSQCGRYVDNENVDLNDLESRGIDKEKDESVVN